MKLQVIDKDNNKIVWTETHDTKESLNKAIQALKANNFNPAHFKYEVSE